MMSHKRDSNILPKGSRTRNKHFFRRSQKGGRKFPKPLLFLGQLPKTLRSFSFFVTKHPQRVGEDCFPQTHSLSCVVCKVCLVRVQWLTASVRIIVIPLDFSITISLTYTNSFPWPVPFYKVYHHWPKASFTFLCVHFLQCPSLYPTSWSSKVEAASNPASSVIQQTLHWQTEDEKQRDN